MTNICGIGKICFKTSSQKNQLQTIFFSTPNRLGIQALGHCKLFSIYVFPKRFSQASLLISNKYFQNKIKIFCLELWYSGEKYSSDPSDLCIPTIDLPILLQEICGPILGIYKSLTDTRMWKLGLRPRNSQKRNVSHKWCDHFYRLLYSSTRHIEKAEGGERDTQLVHVNEATAV